MRISVIILATLLLSETLFPSIDTYELSKIPALIEHYRHHKNLNPEIDLLSFLELHYNDPQHHENDHSTHDKLPFSNHHTGSAQTNPMVFVALELSSFVREILNVSTSSTPYREPAKFTVYITIWQPPRLV
jgi:hypothetical protein